MTNKSPNLSQLSDRVNENVIKPEDDIVVKDKPIEEFKIPYVRGEVSCYNKENNCLLELSNCHDG